MPQKNKFTFLKVWIMETGRLNHWNLFTSTSHLGHPLFFPFSVVRPSQIFGIFKKKKSGDVVKPFFTWNNSFNLKNKHSNSIEKNRNKSWNIFCSILCIPNMWMLTFNVILGYQGLLFQDFFFFLFFRFFFQSDRPTQYQETHSTLNEKKRGWPYVAAYFSHWFYKSD